MAIRIPGVGQLSPRDREEFRPYDLVLNSIELGLGSIRIHRCDIQSQVFQALR